MRKYRLATSNIIELGGIYVQKILIFIISFFIVSKLYSQTSDDKLINIVVTPLGFEQKIKNTNSFIKVISKRY